MAMQGGSVSEGDRSIDAVEVEKLLSGHSSSALLVGPNRSGASNAAATQVKKPGGIRNLHVSAFLFGALIYFLCSRHNLQNSI
jgi:hypothetical protein